MIHTFAWLHESNIPGFMNTVDRETINKFTPFCFYVNSSTYFHMYSNPLSVIHTFLESYLLCKIWDGCTSIRMIKKKYILTNVDNIFYKW